MTCIIATECTRLYFVVSWADSVKHLWHNRIHEETRVLRPSHYKLDTIKISNVTEEDIYEMNSGSSTKVHILMNDNC